MNPGKYLQESGSFSGNFRNFDVTAFRKYGIFFEIHGI